MCRYIHLKGGSAMKIIGITGPTGSGKSTVRQGFAALGYDTLDADALYHSMLVPPSPCLDALRAEFGDSVFAPDGSLDRAALATLVFSDKSQLERLNATVLPIVIERVHAIIDELRDKGAPVLIIDAPTLIESGFADDCDTVLAVSAPEDVRIKRIMLRDGIDKECATRRVRGQKSDEFYRSASDAFIYDDGDAEQLFAKAREATGI